MQLLESLIASGRIVDIMVAVIALEVVAVLVFRRLYGGGIPAVPLLLNVGAGGSLMLALRAALGESGWQWIAAFLVASLVFHVADQFQRWEGRPRD